MKGSEISTSDKRVQADRLPSCFSAEIIRRMMSGSGTTSAVNSIYRLRNKACYVLENKKTNFMQRNSYVGFLLTVIPKK